MIVACCIDFDFCRLPAERASAIWIWDEQLLLEENFDLGKIIIETSPLVVEDLRSHACLRRSEVLVPRHHAANLEK